MCKLFINAKSEMWASHTRSLRIDGMVTSVRLEDYFWRTIDEIAARDGMTAPQMLTRLYHESIDAGHDLGNFTSFLRVCCLRYMHLQLDGYIPRDKSVALGDLNAEKVLAGESRIYH